MVRPADDQQALAAPRPHRLPERDVLLGDALHHHWYLQKERELDQGGGGGVERGLGPMAFTLTTGIMAPRAGCGPTTGPTGRPTLTLTTSLLTVPRTKTAGARLPAGEKSTVSMARWLRSPATAFSLQKGLALPSPPSPTHTHRC